MVCMDSLRPQRHGKHNVGHVSLFAWLRGCCRGIITTNEEQTGTYSHPWVPIHSVMQDSPHDLQHKQTHKHMRTEPYEPEPSPDLTGEASAEGSKRGRGQNHPLADCTDGQTENAMLANALQITANCPPTTTIAFPPDITCLRNTTTHPAGDSGIAAKGTCNHQRMLGLPHSNEDC